MKIKRKNKNQIIPNDLPIIVSLTVATLCMLPGVAYDPTNLPRLVLISLIAAWTLPQLITILFLRFKSKTIPLNEKILITLIICFFSWAIIGSFFNETAALQELLGDFGRSTGIIAYFSVFILLLWSSHARRYDENRMLENSFRTLFLITNIYFSLQYFGLDPIDWIDVYGVRIIGTFGNPNFASLISAFSTLFFSAQLLFKKPEVNSKQIADLLGFFVSLAFAIENPSAQGIIALLLGLSIQLVSKAPTRIRKKVMLLGATLTAIVTVVSITLIASEKYLSIPLLASNFAFRLLAWDASWRIMLDFPMFGIGFDSLGSWFTQYRDILKAQDSLAYAYADASHNVFLDQGVNGGLLSFILYISIFLVISWTAIRELLIREKLNKGFAFLASTWFAFTFFQLISINQLGVATVGFIIGGLLIGATRGNGWESIVNKKIMIVSFIVAITLALTPIQALRKDIAFLDALSSGDGSRMIISASTWPQNDFYHVRAAEILYNNGFGNLGRQEAEKALKINARNRIALMLLLKDPFVSSVQRSVYLQRLKVLDPLEFKTINANN